MEDKQTRIAVLKMRINQMNIENDDIRKKQERQNAHIKMQEQKIAELEKQIEDLKKEGAVWKPKPDERYYSINEFGYIDSKMNLTQYSTDHAFDICNCFKTREEAEKVVRHLKTRAKLQRIADRLNNGEKIDWTSGSQPKYFIYYDDNEIYVDYYYKNKVQGTIYCLDENFKDIAIKEIGEEELTAYLKGE